MDVRPIPVFSVEGIGNSIKHLAGSEEVVDIFVAEHGGRGDPTSDVQRLELIGMIQARSSHDLGQRIERVGVEVEHPLRLVGDDQSPLSPRVLGGHADRARVGMAPLGLDATDSEHETACRVAPVCADRHPGSDSERGDDFRAASKLDSIPKSTAYEHVVGKQQPLGQGCSHMIEKLDRTGTCAAFTAIDNDEIRIDFGFHHGLADTHELTWTTDAEFESCGLSTGFFTQLRDEVHEFDRGRKCLVVRWRDAIFPDGDAAGLGDFP